MDLGKYGPLLEKIGIRVHTLECRKAFNLLLAVPRLVRIIRSSNPHIVQSWMYHANLLGGIAAKMSGVKKTIWGIRHTSLNQNKATTKAVSWMCAKLSRLIPSEIVCCSDSAARIHAEYCYDPAKLKVIYNGYNIQEFAPSAVLRKGTRNDLGVSENQWVIGMVGRWNPQKDHRNFLEALSLLPANLDVTCLLIGPGVADDNDRLNKAIDEYGVSHRIRLLGPRSDIPAIMNALDVHVLSSAYGEAFPNVVAEAMACGTPCVVTDVGDAAMIVGNDEWVVPPKRPDLLAEAIMKALAAVEHEGRDVVGDRCRDRIVENFSLQRMVGDYQALWERI